MGAPEPHDDACARRKYGPHHQINIVRIRSALPNNADHIAHRKTGSKRSIVELPATDGLPGEGIEQVRRLDLAIWIFDIELADPRTVSMAGGR
jgi:hypothetical protein